MLVKEKKPNEYTREREGESIETDTPHKAQAGSAQAGTCGGADEGQAGSLGAAHIGTGQDRTGLGRSHMVRGTWHLMETRSRPADSHRGPGGEQMPRGL